MDEETVMDGLMQGKNWVLMMKKKYIQYVCCTLCEVMYGTVVQKMLK